MSPLTKHRLDEIRRHVVEMGHADPLAVKGVGKSRERVESRSEFSHIATSQGFTLHEVAEYLGCQFSTISFYKRKYRKLAEHR